MKYIGNLNKDGMERFGKIFPDGRVPLAHGGTRRMTIGGKTDHFFFMSYRDCTFDERSRIRGYMHNERKIRIDMIDACLESFDGTIPIRASLIDTAIQIGGIHEPEDGKR